MLSTILAPEKITFTEAQRLTDGKLLQPLWLPSEGLVLVDVVIYRSGVSPNELFATTLKYRESSTNWVVVTQFYGKLIRRGIPTNTRQATIRGYPAVFITELIPSNVRPDGVLRVTSCAWDALFSVELLGADLSYEQLTRVVESLV